MPKRVFITAAEASADQHAAQLVRALRQLDPTLEIEGLGGQQMAAAGVRIHFDTVNRAAMGWRAALRAWEVHKLLKSTRTLYQNNNPPDLHICCDSWSMNVHFAQLAKQFKTPVLYYIAPQTWASREGRVKTLRQVADQLACIWPFEEEYFRRHGVNATYVGHPLFDEIPSASERAVARAGERFPNRPPVIGILAGSRKSIARANFPHLMDVAQRLRADHPDATFLLPTAPATHQIIIDHLRRTSITFSESAEFAPADTSTFRVAADAFDRFVPRCDLCLTVSGTAVTHTAAYGVPMIVVYRVNPILWHAAGRWIVRTRTYSMVNMLADTHDHIVPEFIPWYGSNAAVADTARDFLRHPEKLVAQSERLRRLIQALDQPGAAANAARLGLAAMGVIAAPEGRVPTEPPPAAGGFIG